MSSKLKILLSHIMFFSILTLIGCVEPPLPPLPPPSPPPLPACTFEECIHQCINIYNVAVSDCERLVKSYTNPIMQRDDFVVCLTNKGFPDNAYTCQNGCKEDQCFYKELLED